MRFQAVEAQLALETKLAAVRELNLKVYQAQIQVAEKTLELMRIVIARSPTGKNAT